MEKLNALGNINYNKEEGYAVFSLNSTIYPLEIVYSAAYILIDKMYIILDGDPAKEILVEIRRKDPKQDINSLVMEFNNELLNYAVYKQQSEKNKVIRETLLQRILLTNSPEYFDALSKQIANKENVQIEDNEGIMRKWEDTDDYKCGDDDKKI